MLSMTTYHIQKTAQIREGTDFLVYNTPATWIISNPPWRGRGYAPFAKDAYDLAEHVVWLCRWDTLLGTGRRHRDYYLESGHKLAEIIMCDWKEANFTSLTAHQKPQKFPTLRRSFLEASSRRLQDDLLDQIRQKTMKERSPRSQKYQYLIVESVCTPDHWTMIEEHNGVYDDTTPPEVKEHLLDLNEKLHDLFKGLFVNLTPRQQSVLNLISPDLTQWDIAKKLDCDQSSIFKCLKGNANYNDPSRKKFGGVGKKLKLLLIQSTEIRSICKEIYEINDTTTTAATSWTALPTYGAIRSVIGPDNFVQWLNGEYNLSKRHHEGKTNDIS